MITNEWCRTTFKVRDHIVDDMSEINGSTMPYPMTMLNRHAGLRRSCDLESEVKRTILKHSKSLPYPVASMQGKIRSGRQNSKVDFKPGSLLAAV